MKSFFALVLSMIFVVWGHADSKGYTQTCFSKGKPFGEKWNYCLTATDHSQTKDVIYFFHGIAADENSWISGINSELRAATRARWVEKRVDAPLVVTISLSKKWLLNEHNFKLMTQKIIPLIEAEHLDEYTGRRILYGVSQGGFNALQLYFRWPEFWTKAVFISPFIPLCDPYKSGLKIVQCIHRDPYHKNFFATQKSHEMIREFFRTKEIWNQSNPMLLAQNFLNKRSVPIFLSTGTNDEFGFFAKSKVFAERAVETGAPLVWEATNETHARYDPLSVADFIAE